MIAFPPVLYVRPDVTLNVLFLEHDLFAADLDPRDVQLQDRPLF
jgi:hypothetical protein